MLLAALRSGPSVGQLPVGHLAEAGSPARQLLGGANLLSREPSGTWGSIFQASKISGLNVFTYHHHLESRFLKQAKTLTNGNDTNDTSRGKTNRVGIQQGNCIFFASFKGVAAHSRGPTRPCDSITYRQNTQYGGKRSYMY